jgi:hypothetical protein
MSGGAAMDVTSGVGPEPSTTRDLTHEKSRATAPRLARNELDVARLAVLTRPGRTQRKLR